MPIKLNVVDNNSSVRVKPKSDNEVPVKPNCGIDNARYEALVNKERQERIAADEALQAQIDENKINFIPLDNYITVDRPQQKEGIIPENILVYLRNNKLSKVILGNKIYYLSVRDGNIQQYFSNTSNNTSDKPNLNRVDLNIKTGEFIIKDTWLDAQMKLAINHINNSDIHITPNERLFWNTKLNCADKISDDPEDENYENWILNRN